MVPFQLRRRLAEKLYRFDAALHRDIGGAHHLLRLALHRDAKKLLGLSRFDGLEVLKARIGKAVRIALIDNAADLGVGAENLGNYKGVYHALVAAAREPIEILPQLVKIDHQFRVHILTSFYFSKFNGNITC